MSLGRLTVEASSLAVINDLVKQADLMSRMPQEGAALRQILRLETPLPSALLSWFTIAVIMWLQAAHEGPLLACIVSDVCLRQHHILLLFIIDVDAICNSRELSARMECSWCGF